MTFPISVTIITKNEVQNLERCLKSVEFADDIVVLDCGSSDETCGIAEKMGARVFVEEWRGFGPQKKRAVELAHNDWILSLDGDEALDEEAQEFVKSFASEPKSALTPSAFRFARESFHLGRWIRHGGWSPDYQTRLFDRRRANWTEDVVHEKVERRRDEGESAAESGDTGKIGEVKTAKGKIKHWVFRDLAHQIDTNNRYSSLGAEALYAKGVRFSFSKLIFKSYSKFMETYILKRGFRDGLPGFIISVGASYSVFLKFSKLWEMEKKTKTRGYGKDQG